MKYLFALLLSLFVLVGSAEAANESLFDAIFAKPSEAAAGQATLFGSIDDALVNKAIKQLHEANKTAGGPITLFIESPGGSVFAMLRLLDAMDASERQVNTVCVGMCASAAGVVFLHGVERVMSPRSLLLIHDGATGAMNTTEKVYSQIAMEQRIDAEVIAYVAQLCGLSPTEVRIRASVDWWLWADEAVKLHFATKVARVPQYPVQ